MQQQLGNQKMERMRESEHVARELVGLMTFTLDLEAELNSVLQERN